MSSEKSDSEKSDSDRSIDPDLKRTRKDGIDSQDHDPDRTKPELKGARAISQPRRTRAAKLKARIDTRRLDTTAFPPEVLIHIFDSFLTSIFIAIEARNSLAACSLVCRKWSWLAQTSLHKEALIPMTRRLSQFHRTLQNSQLGRSVRRLGVSISGDHDSKPPIPVGQMIVDCLQCTPNLRVLCLDVNPPASLTDAVIEGLRVLPRLKYFQLDQGNHPRRAANTSGFDPMLLGCLPSTVEKLSLVHPFLDVVRALPDFLQRIYPSQPAAQAVELPDGAWAQRNGGLKLLEIATGVPRTSNAIDFPALTGTTSVPATLTTLSLRLVSQNDNNEQELWNTLIGSCKRLETIDISVTLVAPSIFHTMPLPKPLRVLRIHVQGPPTSQDTWDVFSDSIVDYVAKASRLTDFSLRALLARYTQDSVDHFIHHLLAVLYTKKQCRLRSFSFGVFNRPRLNSITDVGPARILQSSQFVAPSISTFEHLCMEATLLEELEIAVPLDFLPRVTDALETLEYLSSVNLHNYPLRIDPAVPFSQMDQYETFLHCCEILKNHQAGIVRGA